MMDAETVPVRRAEVEKHVIGSYYDAKDRYFDENQELVVVNVHSGNYYVTDQRGEMIVTILGSCVAACLRDPLTGIGGMNHFLVPGNYDNDLRHASDAARFGVYAMEQLINEILKKGGAKQRLEAKVFGGGNVTSSSAMIGTKNADFVREFLKREGITIASEHLGGTLPRRIHYYPDTGKVMMRLLKRKEDLRIIDEEQRYERTITTRPVEGDVDLF